MNIAISTRGPVRRLLLIGLTAVFAAACGSNDKSTGVDTTGTNPPPPPPNPVITLTPDTVKFTDTTTAAAPGAATVAITNTGSATLSGLSVDSITFGAGATGWLSAKIDSTTAPSTLTLTPNVTGLAAGTYTATVPVKSSVANVASKSVTATMTVVTGTIPVPNGNVILAVGNARCNSNNIGLIEAIVDSNPQATLINLGDMTFSPGGGSANDFTTCYGPHLGRFLNRTYAVVGSWEEDARPDSTALCCFASGADAFFGPSRVGPASKNYYSFDIGTTWHVVMLNVISGGPRTYGNNSDELDTFLKNDLAAHPAKCILAVWHDPMWYSSASDTTGAMYPDEHPNQSGVWLKLQQANADVVLNGGEHTYERIGPLRWDQATAKPVADSVNGMVQFNSGLGGDGSTAGTFRQKQSQYFSGGIGVLKLTLGDSTYAWQFLNAPGSMVADSGVGRCH